MKPARLQLSRRAGFRLQEHSLAVNGLPAISVARPGKWGNPFPAAEFGQAEAVRRFREYLEGFMDQLSVRVALAELSGKNLACWCRPGEPCHADVLLELANGPICEAVES